MTQPLTTILAGQRELTRSARLYTGDINEAALLVGRVVSAAYGKLLAGRSDVEVADEMRADLERLMGEARPRRH